MNTLEKVINQLKDIARKDSIKDSLDPDHPYIEVDNYAAGNIDDAFWLGCDEGEINLARKILEDLGRKW